MIQIGLFRLSESIMENHIRITCKINDQMIRIGNEGVLALFNDRKLVSGVDVL